MEKKVYVTPMVEKTQVQFSHVVLSSPPATPVTPPQPAPRPRTQTF